jgi:hypothetical protein
MRPGCARRRWHGTALAIPLGMQTSGRRRLPPRRAWIAPVAAVLFTGCGGAEEVGSGTAADTTAVVPDSTVAVAAPDSGTGCPEWGLWRVCSVERRLERAGLRIERGEEAVRHDFMDVEGVVWKTPRTEVQVFLYASAAARASDLQDMDTVNVTPLNRRHIWPQPATLVTSGNLTAIVIGLNGRETERIALALGAGLPARGPD